MTIATDRTSLPLVRCLLVIAGATTGASAAELVVRDLHATFSLRPRTYDFTLDAGTSQLAGSDGFDSATGLDTGVRWSWTRPGDAIGLVVGVDLALQGLTDDQGSLGSFGLRPVAGVGWAATDRWEFSTLLGYTVALAQLDLDASNAAPALDADGDYRAFDITVNAAWRLTSEWLLTGHLGYLTGSHDLDGEAGGQPAAVTMDLDGFMLGFGVMWRWSTAPVRLER